MKNLSAFTFFVILLVFSIMPLSAKAKIRNDGCKILAAVIANHIHAVHLSASALSTDNKSAEILAEYNNLYKNMGCKYSDLEGEIRRRFNKNDFNF